MSDQDLIARHPHIPHPNNAETCLRCGMHMTDSVHRASNAEFVRAEELREQQWYYTELVYRYGGK